MPLAVVLGEDNRGSGRGGCACPQQPGETPSTDVCVVWACCLCVRAREIVLH